MQLLSVLKYSQRPLTMQPCREDKNNFLQLSCCVFKQAWLERLHTVHFLLLAKIHKSPTWTGPGGKLSYRSAINQKVRLFAGSVCPWPQGQAEVGRDQEHPGNTSHGPNKLKFGQTYYFYISKNRA